MAISGTDSLEVPTYFSGLNFREYPHKKLPYTVQHLHLRILKFPLIIEVNFFSSAKLRPVAAASALFYGIHDVRLPSMTGDVVPKSSIDTVDGCEILHHQTDG